VLSAVVPCDSERYFYFSQTNGGTLGHVTREVPFGWIKSTDARWGMRGGPWHVFVLYCGHCSLDVRRFFCRFNSCLQSLTSRTLPTLKPVCCTGQCTHFMHTLHHLAETAICQLWQPRH